MNTVFQKQIYKNILVSMVEAMILASESCSLSPGKAY